MDSTAENRRVVRHCNVFIVRLQTDIPFVGRDALLRQRQEGIRRQYVQLLLTDHDHELDMWSWGGEPIYRNGNYCGQTTTTSYGYTFKKQVGPIR